MDMEVTARLLDLKLAHYCGPALAGIKASNTIWIQHQEQEELIKAIGRASTIRPTMADIKAAHLYSHEDRGLYLIYSEETLGTQLNTYDYQEFLHWSDYQGLAGEALIAGLKKRFAGYRKGACTFPHELSCFLGYPAADIRGYIENKGKNYLLCGYWKVYHKPERARELFAWYDAERAGRMRGIAIAVSQ